MRFIREPDVVEEIIEQVTFLLQPLAEGDALFTVNFCEGMMDGNIVWSQAESVLEQPMCGGAAHVGPLSEAPHRNFGCLANDVIQLFYCFCKSLVLGSFWLD